MRLGWYLIICLLSAFAAFTPFATAQSLKVNGVRYGLRGEETRIVIDLNETTEFRAFHLSNPYRIVVDIPASTWNTSKSKQNTSNGLIKSYRSGNIENGLTRIIFDLRKPAIINNIFSLPQNKSGSEKNRIVIDLLPSSVNMFTARKEDILGILKLKKGKTTADTESSFRKNQDMIAEQAAPSNTASARQIPAAPAQKPAQQKYTIIIDPGHGGEDPGAINGGTKEKNITLAIAKELKRQLEETGRYRAILTRKDDTYIKLRDRVDFSRKMEGHLFVSIHADKIDRKNVRGASIYTLSEKASDAETERLADAENNSGVVAGVDLAQETQDVANILLDLAMREKMNESNLFSRYLEKALLSEEVQMLPNSHRSAGFAVLKAPDVTSVLIETGFLSNPEEVKLLNTAVFQRKIANAILDGIDAYFRKIEALKKI